MPQAHQFCRDSSRMREHRHRTLSGSSYGSQESQDSAVELSPRKIRMVDRPRVRGSAPSRDRSVEATSRARPDYSKRRVVDRSRSPERRNSHYKRPRQDSERRVGPRERQKWGQEYKANSHPRQFQDRPYKRGPGFANKNSPRRYKVNVSDVSDNESAEEDERVVSGGASDSGRQPVPPVVANEDGHVKPPMRTAETQIDSRQNNSNGSLHPLTEREKLDEHMKQIMTPVLADYVYGRFKCHNVPAAEALRQVELFAMTLKLRFDGSSSLMDVVWDFLKTVEGPFRTHAFLRQKLAAYKVREQLRREEEAAARLKKDGWNDMGDESKETLDRQNQLRVTKQESCEQESDGQPCSENDGRVTPRASQSLNVAIVQATSAQSSHCTAAVSSHCNNNQSESGRHGQIITAVQNQCKTTGNNHSNASENGQNNVAGTNQRTFKTHTIQTESKQSVPASHSKSSPSPPPCASIKDRNTVTKCKENPCTGLPPSNQSGTCLHNVSTPPLPPVIKHEPPEPTEDAEIDEGYYSYVPSSEPEPIPPSPPLFRPYLPTRVVSFDNKTQKLGGNRP